MTGTEQIAGSGHAATDGGADTPAAAADPVASLARLRRAIDLQVAAAKRDLAAWLERRGPKDSAAVRTALLETVFDRYLAERADTAFDLHSAAADALDMVQPVLRRAVQRRRVALHKDASKKPAAAAISVTNEECTKRLTQMLNLLDLLAAPLPEDAALRQFIDDAAEPLGTLLGYFVGAIEER